MDMNQCADMTPWQRICALDIQGELERYATFDTWDDFKLASMTK